MDRRGFLKSTSVAAALVAAQGAAAPAVANPAAPAVKTGPRRLRLTMDWAPGVAGPADMAHRLALRIREASGDRLQLALQPASELEQPSSFAVGDAECHHGCEPGRTSQNAALAYFTGLPSTSGLTAADLETWISYGGGQELWDELAAGLGYKPLLAGHLGAAPLLWTRHPLSNVDSFRDLRIASSGPTADVARALGASPVAVPAQRLPSVLHSGLADAVEFGAALNAMGSGLAQTARFGYAPGISASGMAVALRIRLDVWDSLGSADRAILSTCASEAFQISLSETRLSNALLLQTLQTRHGLKLTSLPDDVAAALPHISEAVVAGLATNDEISQRINASYMGFRRRRLEENQSALGAGPTV
jgi:TRAP-type mannitol/chloroaromatic compound transport system substrate-binding protein